MQKLIILIVIILMSTLVWGQADDTIEMGTFNIRFFPCNQDADMMIIYDIQLRYPPKGTATDTVQLFNMLKNLGIEILGVQEIVDPPLFGAMAKRHLGENYEFVFAPSNGWQKVGFLYNSDKVKLIGEPSIYNNVTLGTPDRLRPAFHGYFKAIPDGFDFHVLVVHLKASPSGYEKRIRQWQYLEEILDSLPTGAHEDADIVLLGDFNNVSRNGSYEFLPIMNKLDYFWIGTENDSLITSYWRPDYSKPIIKGSNIDQIVISADAKIEYIEGSTKVDGFCREARDTIEGDFPDYYFKISDHCPVYSSFRAFPDDD